MRILLVNKFLHPRGGAERAVLTLGTELERRGHRVFWFGMQHAENMVRGPDVELVRARDYRGAGLGRFRDAAALLYSFEARSRFDRLLERARPHVVHVHNLYHQLTPSVLDAARDRGVPVVMTLHDYKLVCPRYDMLRRGHPCDACVEEGPAACLRYRCGGSWAGSLLLAAEAALHRLRGSYSPVRRFLVPSRFLLGVLQRGGWEEAKLRHLPNFASATAPAPEQAHAERFLYAGRLAAEKGIGTLLRAVGGLGRGTLVVCGSGPLEAEVGRAAAAAPERIVLRGHLPAADLWREMTAARFTVLPSECFENAPLALLESMALGRAVLASRIGGIPELVAPGETGELVPAWDSAAWRAALERALADPERMRRMGDAARRAATERFGLGRHVDAVESVYAEVAA
jgi:glycosyltransferase involved in cell wall biosynthesis